MHFLQWNFEHPYKGVLASLDFLKPWKSLVIQRDPCLTKPFCVGILLTFLCSCEYFRFSRHIKFNADGPKKVTILPILSTQGQFLESRNLSPPWFDTLALEFQRFLLFTLLWHDDGPRQSVGPGRTGERIPEAGQVSSGQERDRGGPLMYDDKYI